MNDIESPNDIARKLFVDVMNAFFDKEAELLECGFSPKEIEMIVNQAKVLFKEKCDKEIVLTTHNKYLTT